MLSQSTDTVIMIRPKHFGFNYQTAESNFFQKNDSSISPAEAILEFDNAVSVLRTNSVKVIVCEDAESIITPDSVFPNN